MKIENMKINSYGKLHNIDINLDDKINIIQGENESGKSTILKFIVNSFYGTSKNKKGKDISDFEKFKPWDGDDFSGKIKYKLDNGEIFEIYREFNKKNPKLFNENMEDISKQFNIDKNKGNEFFYEQTKIDEELFLSTSATLQQEVKIEKNKQTTLIQKIANLVGTGDDNVSYKRAIERLTRRQLDEVGTERSREKPINVISKRIKEIKEEVKELQEYEKAQYEIEEEKRYIIENIINKELKADVLKEVKNINDRKEIENEKIKIQEKLKIENEEKIKLIKNEIEENKKEGKKQKEKIIEKNINNNKKIINKLNIFLIIIILINILQFLIIKNKIFNYIFLLTVPMYLAIYFIIKNKFKKINNNNLNNNYLIINNLENELNILEKNKNNFEKEINKLNSEFNLKYNLEKEKIKNKYSDKIEEKEIKYLINQENINYLLEKLQNDINNEKIKVQTLEIKKENFEHQLETKANLEEELAVLSKQYVNLQNLNLSMNLAKEILTSSYEKMKESVTPKFTEQLSNTISKITSRKIQ